MDNKTTGTPDRQKNKEFRKDSKKVRPLKEGPAKKEARSAAKELLQKITGTVSDQYDRYCVYRIRRSKKRNMMKRRLSKEEYLAYRIQEFKKNDWKEAAVFAGILILVILLISSVIGAFSSGPKKQPAPETEAESETETETEKIYPERDITFGSTGAMMLHSPFMTSYPDEEGNYDFASVFRFITPYYSKPDIMTCEFEGSLGGPELEYSGYPMFNSPDIIIENIRDSGVDLQMLATNHIYDSWSAGFDRSIDVYLEKGIAFTGVRKSENDKQYYITDVNGVKLGFLDYVYETPGDGTNLNGMPMEEGDGNRINSFDYDHLDVFYKEVEKNISLMKEEDARFLVIQLHWGNEYQLEEADFQNEIAQKLCDLGIDAIIGGHTHCEQPMDIVTSSDGTRKIFIIYSEGNALSNQRTYLMDEMPTGHTEDGVMITLTLHQDTKGKVSVTGVEMLPTWVYRYADTSGSKYFILPLDDVENIESVTGISGIYEEAKASYDRTVEELGPGLEKVRAQLPLE